MSPPRLFIMSTMQQDLVTVQPTLLRKSAVCCARSLAKPMYVSAATSFGKPMVSPWAETLAPTSPISPSQCLSSSSAGFPATILSCCVDTSTMYSCLTARILISLYHRYMANTWTSKSLVPVIPLTT
ncbi:unnamed protein product [Gongylonema pulchrum]|uniref:Uncharacterized protein n=1 Tax=Gongylonema pulchrum TaxID=637853 RepID=A0A183EKQ2_9BILA|nr:unnamed protein product [Gongylonema pulchrum]